MDNYNLNKKYQFLFPFLFIIGIFLLVIGFNDKKAIFLNYNSNNSIKYNVYLKENVFFDEPFLPEGRTYIASLIDYIDVFFHYDVSFDRNLSGEYKYKYVALIRANKTDGDGYYWEKEYDLTEEQTKEITNSANVIIDENIKVDYAKYNDVVKKFKKTYGVETDPELKIIMKVSNTSKVEEFDKPVEFSSEMNLTIPLLEQSLEVSINKDVSNENNAITLIEKSKKPAFLLLKIDGLALIIIAILGFIHATKVSKEYKELNQYEVALNDILNNYDSIIANVENMPNIKDFKRIDVSSFEELIDVYNEVRMPINYYQEKKESVFVIINDSIVWIYTLKKSNSKKRVDNNEKKQDKRKSK